MEIPWWGLVIVGIIWLILFILTITFGALWGKSRSDYNACVEEKNICMDNLTICSASKTACANNLATCNTDKIACDTEKETCVKDKTTCDTSLKTCSSKTCTQPRKYGEFKGTDYLGGDIGGSDGNSTICKPICDAISNCTGFVTDGKKCVFKNITKSSPQMYPPRYVANKSYFYTGNPPPQGPAKAPAN